MRDPRTLTDARLQLHWAAQLAATVGRTLSPPRPDDSHTSFRWVDDALVQDDAFRSGLRLRDLTLVLGDDNEFALDGRTIDDGFAWLASQLPGLRKEFNEPLPQHAVASGAPFSLRDGEAFEELSRYYAEAARLLRAIHDDVRCWPHHFDIATLLELDGKSIGAGLSPGDDSCDEPYWYVNHYPPTSRRDLPPLAGGGTWNTSGWVGGILRASAGGDAKAFLDSAVAASREILQ